MESPRGVVGSSLLCLSILVDFLSAAVMSAQTLLYAREGEAHAVSPAETGIVFGVSGLACATLATFIGGVVVPRLGAPTTYFLGMLVLGTSFCLFGLMPWFLVSHDPFLVASILLRVTEAIGMTAANTALVSVIAANFPGSLASCAGALESAYGVGLGFGPMSATMLSQYGGFAFPFLTFGVIILLCALASIPILRRVKCSVAQGMEHSTAADDSECGSSGSNGFAFLRQVFGQPSMALLILTLLATTTSSAFVLATLEPHVRHELEASPWQKMTVFSVYGTTLALLMAPFGIIADRWLPPIYLVLGGNICTTLSFVLIGPILKSSPLEGVGVGVSLDSSNLANLWLTGWSLLLLGLGSSMTSGPATAQFIKDIEVNGLEYNDTTLGLANGIWFTTVSLGGLIGPAIGGLLLERWTFTEATTFPLLLMLLVLLAQLTYMRGSQGREAVRIAWNVIVTAQSNNVKPT